MEKKNIKVLNEGEEYNIELTKNEYIIDEPAGGGSSVRYKIKGGIPFKVLKNVEMFKIDERLVKYLADKELFEYDWHYLWEPGFRDMFYYALTRSDGVIHELHFSELEGKIKLTTKF
jgi:hypothetical protein